MKSPYLSKLVLVAALGYFVDIYDLVLFGMERVSSLNDLLSQQYQDPMVLKAQVQKIGISLLNWQMFGMLLGGIFWGILGDKKGRLSVLFGSILLYSLANLANAMVQNTSQYALLRFISGFGLAGELGAGITLVSETLQSNKRGYGATLVASVGLFGAVIAGTVGIAIGNWRISYLIGGIMGLLLLIMRIGVLESNMFTTMKIADVSRGNFFLLFTSRKRFIKLISIILIALPVWYVMGILITLCPELMKDQGMPDAPQNARLAMTIAYVGITLGDVVSGLLSQKLKSRKLSLLLFLFLTLLGCILYFTFAHHSGIVFYSIVFSIGFATGYWAVFISTAAELFGTNLRSTVTTCVPNFVRGGTIPITILFQYLSSTLYFNKIGSAITVGILVFALSFWAWYKLEETFHKNLDYLE